MAKVELKQPIVQEISDNIKDAASVVVINYQGLTVAQDTELRKQLRDAGVIYKVYKNTLVRFAVKDTDYAPLTDVLEGPNAIAISKDDATAPARIIAGFTKTAPTLELKGGIVEGKYYDEAGMQEIAKVPSREELLGRLLGSMQAPIANLARVLNQIAKKKEEGGEQPAAEEAAPAEAAAPAEDAAPAE